MYGKPRRDIRKITLDAPISLTRTGAYIKYDDIDAKTMKRVRGRFVIIIPSAIGGPPTTIRQHKTTRGDVKYLRLPRFGVFSELTGYTIKSKIRCSSPNNPRLKWIGTLNPNQEVILTEIKRLFAQKHMLRGKAGLTLHVEAGRGKTFIAASVMSWLAKKTLIVVHTKGILIQWRKILAQWAPHAKIGFYYGDKKVDGDVVIALIQSLAKDKFKWEGDVVTPSSFYAQFDLMIVDECHLMLSNKRSQLFWKGSCPYMIGLSATPKDDIQGRNVVSEWGLGPVMTAKDLPDFSENEVKFTGRIHMIKYCAPNIYSATVINEHTGLVSVPQLTTQVLRDPYRLFVVSREVIKLMNKGLNILVFATRRQYLLDIREYMKHLGVDCVMVDEEIVTRLVGGASEAELERAEKNAQVILTTYQYMSVGKSIPRMNAMVLATPRKSYSEQTIKRIFRLGSDNTIERQIVDVVDWNTSLKTQWYSRNQYYKSQGFAVEKTKLEWNSDEISGAVVNNQISTADEIGLLTEILDNKEKSDTESVDLNDIGFDDTD